MKDLWPDFSNGSKSEESQAVELLRAQAKTLSQKTEGKVKASFSKVNYKSVPLTSIQKIAAILPTGRVLEEEVDEELQNKKDFNDLYQPTKYKFEIYNTTYRFRVFTLSNSMFFPISFEIDEGFLEEISMFGNKNPIEVSNNAELEDLVKNVFSSKKVRTIVSRMMEG